MNSITITTGMNTTTEVVENSHVYLEDSTNDFAAFTEWYNVPTSLQSEMTLCIQEINCATSRLQGVDQEGGAGRELKGHILFIL